MEPHERLRLAREKAGYEDASSAARAFGWPEATYRSHENGTRNFTTDGAKRYGRALRVSPEWLLLGIGSSERAMVPLVGDVGAGALIYPFDDGGALDEIEPPPGVGPSAVAVRVRGDSMFPRYMEGDILIYDRHDSITCADGQECVVSLPDGRKFVKLVRSEPDGSVTLESWNAPPMRGLRVDWVAVVRWIKRAKA